MVAEALAGTDEPLDEPFNVMADRVVKGLFLKDSIIMMFIQIEKEHVPNINIYIIYII